MQINFEFDGNNVVRIGRKTPIVKIVRDAKYLQMWRVERSDGTLIDMVNRTRAKDAALALARRIVEDEFKSRQGTRQKAKDAKI